MAADLRESQASERYLTTCKRLTVLPEPLLLRVLRKPYEHSGEYSTTKAEVLLDADGIRAIVASLAYARGLHTVRLVGLRQGGGSMMSRDTLMALVRTLNSASVVETLDLSDNNLADKDAATATQMLIGRKSALRCFTMRNNNLGEQTGSALLLALENNRSSVRHIDVGQNPMMWPKWTEELKLLMQPNQTLTGFGATLSDAVAGQFVATLNASRSRLSALFLTHSALSKKTVDGLVSLLTAKQASEHWAPQPA